MSSSATPMISSRPEKDIYLGNRSMGLDPISSLTSEMPEYFDGEEVS
jgi:hypothetical protein